MVGMNSNINEIKYFAPQISKSDFKIAVLYGRMFRLAGLSNYLPSGPVLDIGCGAGPGLRYLTARGARVYGADSSRYALLQAQKLVRQVDLLQIDALSQFPFKDFSFGLIVANELIEHLPEGITFLKECYRLLRPGGVVLLTTPNLWDIRRLTHPLMGKPWSGDTDPTHINLYTPARLRDELSSVGFQYPRVHTGLKPIRWLPPWKKPIPLAYPPYIGNGIVATGVR